VKESRWLRWIGPGAISVGAVGLLVSTVAGAGQRAWTERACGDESGGRVAAARSAAGIGLGDQRLQPWFRLDPRLDRAGALQGQRLALGLDGNRSSRIMDLPPESFAAGPFGRIVLVGTDDGTTSRLDAVDVAAECSWAVAEESAVIRRATLDLPGTTIYEMRVDRTTRADLGVWARPLDGSLPALPILEPIGADERFGPTYTTEFAWDLSGRTLAVQSCGEAACRTRVLDPAGESLRAVAESDLGSIVGLEGDVLVTYAACPGFPCPIIATDLATGARSVLADAGTAAVAVATPDGPRLVHEYLGESGFALRSVAFDGSSATDLGRLPDGRRLHPSTNASQAATRVPPGWVVLSPEGRLPDDGPSGQTQLRHVPDGTTVQLDEVAR
jgi:hypothetical protein